MQQLEKECALGTKDICAKITQKWPLAKTSYKADYVTVKLIVYSWFPTQSVATILTNSFQISMLFKPLSEPFSLFPLYFHSSLWLEECHCLCESPWFEAVMPALKGSGEHISLRGVLNGAACLVNSGKASFLDAVLKFYRQQSVPLQHLPKPIRDALTDPQRAYQHSLEGTTSIVAHIWLPLLLMENTERRCGQMRPSPLFHSGTGCEWDRTV